MSNRPRSVARTRQYQPARHRPCAGVVSHYVVLGLLVVTNQPRTCAWRRATALSWASLWPTIQPCAGVVSQYVVLGLLMANQLALCLGGGHYVVLGLLVVTTQP